MSLKTALITGASRGIGYNLTRLFARDNHGVILVSRTKSDLEQVAKELKTKFQCPQVTVIATDLSKPNSARQLYEEVKNRYKLPVDFLVNNAGTGVRSKIWETKIERDLEIIQLNITSMVELTKLVLPEMLERNDGRILMLGSSAAFQPNPLLASYAATKAFIASYTDALVNELQDSKVTATLLVPGPTDTDFFDRAGASKSKVNKMNSLDDPADVALRGYEALIKGDHRAYGLTKVKLMVGVGQIVPNEFITMATRSVMDEEK